MSYQSKGLQFSLLIHAAVLALIAGADISESRREPAPAIDLSIVEALKEEEPEEKEAEQSESPPRAEEKKTEIKPIETVVVPPRAKVEAVRNKEKKAAVKTEKIKKSEEKAKKIVSAERKKSKPVKEESAKPMKEKLAKPVKEETAAKVEEASPPPAARAEPPPPETRANENKSISSVSEKAVPISEAEKLPAARSFSENSVATAHALDTGGSGRGISDSKSDSKGSGVGGSSKSASASQNSEGGPPSSGHLTFGGTGGPRYRHKEMPVYPNLARRLGKEGKVLLRLTIDENGSLVNIEVVEDPGYGFADAAVASVKKSTFVPPTWNGRPIATKALLPVKFTLR